MLIANLYAKVGGVNHCRGPVESPQVGLAAKFQAANDRIFDNYLTHDNITREWRDQCGDGSSDECSAVNHAGILAGIPQKSS